MAIDGCNGPHGDVDSHAVGIPRASGPGERLLAADGLQHAGYVSVLLLDPRREGAERNADGDPLNRCVASIASLICLLAAPRAVEASPEFELRAPGKPPDAAELLRQQRIKEGIARRRTLQTVHQAVGHGMLVGL